MNTEDNVRQFNELLRREARLWSSVADLLGPNPGLRVVQIGGTLIREVLLGGTQHIFWQQLMKQLPTDAALLDTGFGPLWMDPTASGYTDVYVMCFASLDWAAVPEGENVPIFPVRFEPYWECDQHMPPYRNEAWRKECEICTRSRP